MQDEKYISDDLDHFCYHNKYNNYTAEKTKRNSYIVTLNFVSYEDVAGFLFDLMVEKRYRVNFLTK